MNVYPFLLLIKWMLGFSKEEATYKISSYKKRHCKAETANAENILSNPTFHDISPPLVWELLPIESNAIQSSKSLPIKIHLLRTGKQALLKILSAEVFDSGLS